MLNKIYTVCACPENTARKGCSQFNFHCSNDNVAKPQNISICHSIIQKLPKNVPFLKNLLNATLKVAKIKWTSELE